MIVDVQGDTLINRRGNGREGTSKKLSFVVGADSRLTEDVVKRHTIVGRFDNAYLVIHKLAFRIIFNEGAE